MPAPPSAGYQIVPGPPGSGGAPSINIQGAGSSPWTNITFVITNVASNPSYQYSGNYGPNWVYASPGPVTSYNVSRAAPLSTMITPYFSVPNGQNTPYDSVQISSDGLSATFITAQAGGAANIVITMQDAGSGGPPKDK